MSLPSSQSAPKLPQILPCPPQKRKADDENSLCQETSIGAKPKTRRRTSSEDESCGHLEFTPSNSPDTADGPSSSYVDIDFPHTSPQGKPIQHKKMVWVNKKKPDFLILKSVESSIIGDSGEAPQKMIEIGHIVGIKQIIPEHDALIHSCGHPFDLGTVADEDLQARIENNSLFKKVKLLMQEQFGVLSFNSKQGWFVPEPPGMECCVAPDWEHRRLLAQVCEIRDGFTMAMSKGEGKRSLQTVFDLCKDILVDVKIPFASAVRCALGVGSRSRLYLQHYMDPQGNCKDDELTISGLHGATNWMHKQKSHEAKPDVIVDFWNKGYYDLFTAEIKSLNESKSPAKCALQSWIQALIGLKWKDIAYGILYQPRAITIFELRKESGESLIAGRKGKHLKTYQTGFGVLAGDSGSFDVSKFVDFIHHLCCILAANLLCGEKM